MSEAEQSRDTTPEPLRDTDQDAAEGAVAKSSDGGSGAEADRRAADAKPSEGARPAKGAKAEDAEDGAEAEGVKDGVEAEGVKDGAESEDVKEAAEPEDDNGSSDAKGSTGDKGSKGAMGTGGGTDSETGAKGSRVGRTDPASVAGRDTAKGADAAADAGTSSARADGGRASAMGAGSAGRGTVAAVRPSAEGRLLGGRYRIGGVLGRGGMGTVWRAVDETLGRTVAVKELRFTSSIDEDEKRRLITRTLREAKAIARIRNTNAVTVYDVVDEDDRPWIVMELVEGKSLAEVLREDGLLTPRRAAEVGLAILDVLRSAHREGILHRDVKPSNVLIETDGRVVLTDFGIAQVEGDPSITSTGMLVGAPSYISPERARGHKPGPAADLWSLGGLLYASVEGCPPYDKGSAIATLTAVMTEPLDPPKNAGPLEEVIYGLLAKDPAQRLDDAGARALLLDVIRMPEAPAVPEPSPEATRVVPLPPLPPEPAVPAKERGKDGTDDRAKERAKGAADAAAERVRSALRSVRNAAAKPDREPVPATATTAATGTRTAPVRAPLTDVVPRRTLVIIALVAALAVLATVLAVAFSGDDKAGGQGRTGNGTAAGGATSGGDGKANDGSGADGTKGDPEQGVDGGKDTAGGDATGKDTAGSTAGTQPSGGPKTGVSAGGGGAPGGLPAGYTMVTNDRFHFTMAMPANFRMTHVAGQDSGGIFNTAKGAFPRVQVDFTGSPGGDAKLAWTQAVAVVSASSDGYKTLSISSVDYKGYPTAADWGFERNQGGQRVRVLNRGFKVDAGHGYSIMVSCKASEWDGKECATLRDTAFATFSPKY
ncbi:serine/threonine-protein kinase [Streptomyces sp. NPDC127084]|uniref:serine/threonine-protein kinase n=1 Tax=Streptomyces sp. NPDC127084 TaxID=3347133 RepID=UPI00364FCF84